MFGKANAILAAIRGTSGAPSYRFGADLYDDIALALPNEKPSLLFDVGANEGQTARTLRSRFPAATIHCFEPNPACCETLDGLRLDLKCHQLAMGSKTATMGFDRSWGNSEMFRLTDDLSGETVQVETIDGFCKQHGIDRIDLLKIDTEGHDLEVIRGANAMLIDRRVAILLAEVSMNALNKYHIGFFDVQSHMENLGYRLFGIYDQKREWPTQQPHMRLANVAYISPRVIDANRRA
jgi:FkbM family methyltransferase